MQIDAKPDSAATEDPGPSLGVGKLGRSTMTTSMKTVGQFGAMMLPFTDKEAGAAKINSSLKTFAKPGTWFAPMWAILVGCVASGNAHWDLPSIGRIVAAMVLAGPLLCAFSQVTNDWFDREVDAINEPDRPTAANLLAPGTVAAMMPLTGTGGIVALSSQGSGLRELKNSRVASAGAVPTPLITTTG